MDGVFQHTDFIYIHFTNLVTDHVSSVMHTIDNDNDISGSSNNIRSRLLDFLVETEISTTNSVTVSFQIV